jgi:hypothetical protein
MTDNIRKPDDHQNLRVDPEVWRMVNSEKRAKDTMNDVLKRVFTEWKTLKEDKEFYAKIKRDGDV